MPVNEGRLLETFGLQKLVVKQLVCDKTCHNYPGKLMVLHVGYPCFVLDTCRDFDCFVS